MAFYKKVYFYSFLIDISCYFGYFYYFLQPKFYKLLTI